MLTDEPQIVTVQAAALHWIALAKILISLVLPMEGFQKGVYILD